MHVGRIGVLIALVAFRGLSAGAAPREPVPLNDYTRLGQQFTVTRACLGLAVVVPSWSDNEGGLTLTLWDSPQRRTALARKAFTDVVDNASLEIDLAPPLPAGTYYWEISDRVGKTRIGLYADRLDAETTDGAYLDGVADPKRRFLFSTVPAAFAFADTRARLAALTGEASPSDRLQAAHELAILAGPEAIPVLAGLLGDGTRGHAARYALEAMPDPTVDAAFREALTRLTGRALVGVINSVAVRHDAAAVSALGAHLRGTDTEVATAAAAALGRIATAAAADALEAALPQAPATLRPALLDACLTCGSRLLEAGHQRRAQALFDRLLHNETNAAVRTAALRGAIVSRGTEGVSLLLEHLRSADPVAGSAAFWVAQHELPGPDTSAALAAARPSLPADRQLLLVGVLGSRGDAAALAAVLELARVGDGSLRPAALRGLGRFAAASAAPALLLTALADPDDQIATAAQETFRGLPAGVADAGVTKLMGEAKGQPRVRAIQIAGTRRIASAVPALLDAARDADPAVRLAARRALGEVAAETNLAAVLGLLAEATTPEDAEATERAVRATCARIANPERCAPSLAALLPQAHPALRQTLLRLLQGVGGKTAWDALLAASVAPEAEIRATAFRLLGEWKTPADAPNLLSLATAAADPGGRLLCLRGALRLAGSKDTPPDQRLALCTAAAPLTQRAEEKKLLLGVLGGLPLPGALGLATPCLSDPTTRTEAGTAILAIAEPLLHGPAAAQARAALGDVAGSAPGSDLARRAEALLAQPGTHDDSHK